MPARVPSCAWPAGAQACSTGAVSGARRARAKKASAACSTSMPRPSRAGAPCARGPGQEGLRPPRRTSGRPPARPGQHAGVGTGTPAPCRLLALALMTRRRPRRARRSRAAARPRPARRARRHGGRPGRAPWPACGWPPPPAGRAAAAAPARRRRAAGAHQQHALAGQRLAGAMLDVAHQADAVGVVGQPALGVEAQHVGRTGQRGAFAVRARPAPAGLELEGHGDVAAAPAGRRRRRAPRLRSRPAGNHAAVVHRLAGLLREGGVDEGATGCAPPGCRARRSGPGGVRRVGRGRQSGRPGSWQVSGGHRLLSVVSSPSSRVKRKREVMTIWSACARIAGVKGPKGACRAHDGHRALVQPRDFEGARSRRRPRGRRRRR
jgi:hypothetical protein